jgi:DNA invertase Pin-like site-specific DNA recombinase
MLLKGDTMRAIGYIRVSTQEQATEGLSLQNQRERIEAYAFAKGWEMIEVIEDAGVSAATLDRPGIQRAIKMAQAGAFDVLVVYKLDRLTRSIKDLGYLIQDVFEDSRVKFSSVSDNFDTTTANGKLILNILGSVAQWERDIIAERTRDVLRGKKDRGEKLGNVPYGFRVIQGSLQEAPAEILTIQRMKRLRRNGLSFQQIADRLNTGKAEAPPKRAEKWSKAMVHRLVCEDVRTRKARFLRRVQ